MHDIGAANVSTGVAIPAFLVSVSNALPLVQIIAGVLAAAASIFAIAVYIKKLRE